MRNHKGSLENMDTGNYSDVFRPLILTDFRPFGTVMRASDQTRPETLLAIVDAATAERVVRLASPVIQEERPFQFFDLLMRGISVLLS